MIVKFFLQGYNPLNIDQWAGLIAPIERHPTSNPSEDPDNDERFRLDPAKFPRRVDLELTPELLEQLEAMARRSGRSLPDLITDLLSREAGPPA